MSDVQRCRNYCHFAWEFGISISAFEKMVLFAKLLMVIKIFETTQYCVYHFKVNYTNMSYPIAFSGIYKFLIFLGSQLFRVYLTHICIKSHISNNK